MASNFVSNIHIKCKVGKILKCSATVMISSPRSAVFQSFNTDGVSFGPVAAWQGCGLLLSVCSGNMTYDMFWQNSTNLLTSPRFSISCAAADRCMRVYNGQNQDGNGQVKRGVSLSRRDHIMAAAINRRPVAMLRQTKHFTSPLTSSTRPHSHFHFSGVKGWRILDSYFQSWPKISVM